jgi:hypothetical protein
MLDLSWEGEQQILGNDWLDPALSHPPTQSTMAGAGLAAGVFPGLVCQGHAGSQWPSPQQRTVVLGGDTPLASRRRSVGRGLDMGTFI